MVPYHGRDPELAVLLVVVVVHVVGFELLEVAKLGPVVVDVVVHHVVV